jgi:maleylacetate reductase
MSLSFVYNAAPGRVLSGAGSLAKLGEEVRRLGLGRVLVLATPSHEAEAAISRPGSAVLPLGSMPRR